ncbi:hypothetical protein ACFPRL_03715 [Pseudoclavibacter helvolus]
MDSKRRKSVSRGGWPRRALRSSNARRMSRAPLSFVSEIDRSTRSSAMRSKLTLERPGSVSASVALERLSLSDSLFRLSSPRSAIGIMKLFW